MPSRLPTSVGIVCSRTEPAPSPDPGERRGALVSFCRRRPGGKKHRTGVEESLVMTVFLRLEVLVRGPRCAWYALYGLIVSARFGDLGGQSLRAAACAGLVRPRRSSGSTAMQSSVDQSPPLEPATEEASKNLYNRPKWVVRLKRSGPRRRSRRIWLGASVSRHANHQMEEFIEIKYLEVGSSLRWCTGKSSWWPSRCTRRASCTPPLLTRNWAPPSSCPRASLLTGNLDHLHRHPGPGGGGLPAHP